MSRKEFLNLSLLLTISLVACKNKTADNEVNDAYRIKGDTVYVRENSAVGAKIKLSEATAAPYSKEIITAGTVQPIPTQIAYIAPPFAGRIVKSYVSIGQSIKENMPLFEISSPDFTAAQKDFFQALSAKELAQKDLKRKEGLIKNGVGSQKELEEALSTLQIAEKEYETAYTALQIYQVNPENMQFGRPLTVLSPISGEIIDNKIVAGQYIKDDAEPVATVANLSQVWIMAQVKEKDIRFIHADDAMEMHIAALPGQTLSGKVFYIEEAVDDATRSIRVLSICDNKERLLKIGMYTTVHFFDTPTDFVHIPENALLQGEKNSFAYVQAAPNIYVRTPVDVEITKDGKVVVANGIKAGQKVISEGGYYLK